jgi:hypothetical protein
MCLEKLPSDFRGFAIPPNKFSERLLYAVFGWLLPVWPTPIRLLRANACRDDLYWPDLLVDLSDDPDQLELSYWEFKSNASEIESTRRRYRHLLSDLTPYADAIVCWENDLGDRSPLPTQSINDIFHIQGLNDSVVLGGDPLDVVTTELPDKKHFRGFNNEPKRDEEQLFYMLFGRLLPFWPDPIAVYATGRDEHGYEPDFHAYCGKTGTWESSRLEMKVLSSQFKRTMDQHPEVRKRPTLYADQVVCWDHDWADCPLPVICLKELFDGLPKSEQDRVFCRRSNPYRGRSLEHHSGITRQIMNEIEQEFPDIAFTKLMGGDTWCEFTFTEYKANECLKFTINLLPPRVVLKAKNTQVKQLLLEDNAFRSDITSEGILIPKESCPDIVAKNLGDEGDFGERVASASDTLVRWVKTLIRHRDLLTSSPVHDALK